LYEIKADPDYVIYMSVVRSISAVSRNGRFIWMASAIDCTVWNGDVLL